MTWAAGHYLPIHRSVTITAGDTMHTRNQKEHDAMADSNGLVETVPADVLLMFCPSEPDTEWEKRLQQKCPVPGQLEIRWVNTKQPDGSFKKPCDFDASTFKDVTMLYSYFPTPNGTCDEYLRGPCRLASSFFGPVADPDPEHMPKLRFVQLTSAGSDLWANHPKYLNKNVVFCTTSGSNSLVSPASGVFLV